MNDPVIFIDIETTGLNADLHVPWEVAVIRDDVEHLWQIAWPVPVLKDADPIAQKINGFNERSVQTVFGLDDPVDLITPKQSAERFAELADGRHLVGAVVSFDEERLRRMHVNCLGWPETGRFPWHYHLIDVEALAIGFLNGVDRPDAPRRAITPPWKSDEITAALGITVTDDDKHTALGDARWARAIYQEVMG